MTIVFSVLGCLLFTTFLGRGLLLDACKTYPMCLRITEASLWILALGACALGAFWPYLTS